MQTIVEGLFAPNSFLSKAFNADSYVNDRIVHIPQAGAPSKIVKNRSEYPAEVKTRTDTDLTYQMSEFTTDPIRIPHADTVELSYDKRNSVLRMDKLALHDYVALDFLKGWSPTSENIITTTGAAVNAHTSKATGMRNAVTKTDIMNLMTRFNDAEIPQEGRYLLLDANMYTQLLNDLTSAENVAFHATADPKNGVLGKLLSFNIMMRSKVLLYKADGTAKEWSADGAATDNAAALAWHDAFVCRALGEVKMFGNEDDPTYYGDIYSFLVRAGGRVMRADGKGVMALAQGTPASGASTK